VLRLHVYVCVSYDLACCALVADSCWYSLSYYVRLSDQAF